MRTRFDVGQEVYHAYISISIEDEDYTILPFDFGIEQDTISEIEIRQKTIRYSLENRDYSVSFDIEKNKWKLGGALFERKEDAIKYIGEKLYHLRNQEIRNLKKQLKLWENYDYTLIDSDDKTYKFQNDYGNKNIDSRIYTNLKDANGKKIYVDDIVWDMETHNTLVVKREDVGEDESDYKEIFFESLYDGEPYFYTDDLNETNVIYPMDDCIVIGNIHDNKEIKEHIDQDEEEYEQTLADMGTWMWEQEMKESKMKDDGNK